MKVNYNNIYKSKSLPYGVCIKPVSFNYVLFASDKIYRYTLDEEIRILLSTGLKLTITYHKHQKTNNSKNNYKPKYSYFNKFKQVLLYICYAKIF